MKILTIPRPVCYGLTFKNRMIGSTVVLCINQGNSMAISTINGVETKAEHIRSVRGMLDWLRLTGDLLETDVPVNPDLEITGVQKHLDGSFPILFKNVIHFKNPILFKIKIKHQYIQLKNDEFANLNLYK